MSTDNLLDEHALVRLRQIGGNRLVAEMIESFLRTAPHRLDEAAAGWAGGNLEPIMRTGHSLKTSCGHLGAYAMRDISVRLEEAAETGQREGIPALIGELHAAFQQVKPILQTRQQAAAATRRIALVEDNPDNRLLVRALLRDLYDVAEYENGALALEGMRRHHPDLVLLDVSLPGMDGLQVLQIMREDPVLQVLPVIALTAHAMAGDRDRYLAAGFNGYVAKPIVDEAVLFDAIAGLIKP